MQVLISISPYQKNKNLILFIFLFLNYLALVLYEAIPHNSAKNIIIIIKVHNTSEL